MNGIKLCPSCNAFQDATKKECPNCGFDLTNVEVHKTFKPRYPTILRRYMATIIDWMLIFFVFIASAYIFSQENEISRVLQIVITLLVLFVYEPLCTSKLCTLGQKVMGVRVRDNISYEHISIPQAYLRIIVKIYLGIISFFTILFTERKRAIHDFAAGSVVIYSNSR